MARPLSSADMCSRLGKNPWSRQSRSRRRRCGRMSSIERRDSRMLRLYMIVARR